MIIMMIQSFVVVIHIVHTDDMDFDDYYDSFWNVVVGLYVVALSMLMMMVVVV